MKQRVQGIVIGFFAATLIFLIATYAANARTVTNNNFDVIVDGRIINFGQFGYESAPVIINNRLFFPVRIMGELMNFQVDFEPNINAVQNYFENLLGEHYICK